MSALPELELEPRDTVTLSLAPDGVGEAQGASGTRVRIGPPGTPDAFTPVELLLVALAGCGAIDVANIAAKQRRPLGSFEVHAHGWRVAGEHRVGRAQLAYDIELDAENERAVRRALELTARTYCTVSLTLTAGCEVVHEIGPAPD